MAVSVFHSLKMTINDKFSQRLLQTSSQHKKQKGDKCKAEQQLRVLAEMLGQQSKSF
jgi:hypothetical protein